MFKIALSIQCNIGGMAGRVLLLVLVVLSLIGSWNSLQKSSTITMTTNNIRYYDLSSSLSLPISSSSSSSEGIMQDMDTLLTQPNNHGNLHFLRNNININENKNFQKRNDDAIVFETNLTKQKRNHNKYNYPSMKATRLQPFQSQNDTSRIIELTPAQKCRLEIFEYLNPLHDHFLSQGEANPPMIDWMWDMGDYYFVVQIKFDSIQNWKKNMLLYHATWRWKDQYEQEFVAQSSPDGTHLLTLGLPFEQQQEQQQEQNRSIPQFLWYSSYTLPEGKMIIPWVYDLRPFINCDRIEQELPEERPPSSTKIGMCIKFAGQHDKVGPFVAYHRMIGVDHFWMYVNELGFQLDTLPQDDSITYVPYPFTMWGKRPIPGMFRLPRPPAHFFQQEVQQHCLYRAKRYGLDWIMTNDLDEYLWVNETEHLDEYRQYNDSSPSVLSTFLQPYESDPNLGSILVNGWAFGSRTPIELSIDMTTRAVTPCGGKDKHIYRVPTARNIGVHWLYDGGKTIPLPMSKIRWNHYRHPDPRSGRQFIYGLRKAQDRRLIKDTMLPHKYRKKILQWIQDHPTPLEQQQQQQQSNGSHSFGNF